MSPLKKILLIVLLAAFTCGAGATIYVKVTEVHLRPMLNASGGSNERPWSKVVQGPGHSAHMSGLEPVRCNECHEIKTDQFDRPSKARCLRCHEDHQPTVHASQAAQRVECLACHKFLSSPGVSTAQLLPWAQCMKCHSEPQGNVAAVTIHAREQCSTCHRPHGTPSLRPRNCPSCHQHEELSSAKHAGSGAQLCLNCHSPHEPAAGAGSRCVTCHVQGDATPSVLVAAIAGSSTPAPAQPPRVPATAVFPGGHDRCTGCHAPHQFTRGTVRSCRSCHSNQNTLGQNRVAAHRNCTSCHNQHDARNLPRGACARCHTNVHPAHPTTQKGTCVGCHDPHPGTPIVAACSSCHTQAQNDTAFHAGGQRCPNCHQPHQFAGLNASLCQRCHAENAQRVRANQGHTNCLQCHQQPHRPAQTKACGQCHRVEAGTAPGGHQNCTRCHEPHSGQVKVAGCPTCHQDRTGPPHGNVPGGCRTCHRQHGPGGVARIPACTSCHQASQLPGVHAVPEHLQNCGRCHTRHARPSAARATCVACHEDRQNHEPQATRCNGCHVFGAQR